MKFLVNAVQKQGETNEQTDRGTETEYKTMHHR